MDKSTSISTQMDSLIPAPKISNLTQGMFVEAVSDNFDERINQKIFHAEIVVNSAKASAEMKQYQPIPQLQTSPKRMAPTVNKEPLKSIIAKSSKKSSPSLMQRLSN